MLIFPVIEATPVTFSGKVKKTNIETGNQLS